MIIDYKKRIGSYKATLRRYFQRIWKFRTLEKFVIEKDFQTIERYKNLELWLIDRTPSKFEGLVVKRLVNAEYRLF